MIIDILVLILLIGVGAYFIREDIKKKKAEKKEDLDKGNTQVAVAPTQPAVVAPVQPAVVQPTIPAGGPCDDKRNGKYNPNWDQVTCNKNGYFFCPISHRCMPSSVNVNACGKPSHLM